MTLGSLFDGSGGFPLAGMLGGIEPIWNSEIEPFAVRVTEKRMPTVKHYGDISKISGAEIPPVDIITFGSPCQDMSIAGKRSGLFHEAIRIVEEMRCKTNGKYPKYIVWENVCGAFSSNGGEDFRCVLEEICRVKEPKVSVPSSEKWNHAGLILGDDYSVAWRTLDAQYWGVPQRRKRIFLVADFNGKCAGKILFESEGLSGYSAESFRTWQRVTSSLESSPNAESFYVCDGEGRKVNVYNNHSNYENNLSETSVQLFENHSQDARYKGPLNVAPTILATYGTGGNNHPFVVNTFDVRFTSEGTKNVRSNCYETYKARTLDTGGNSPDSNQGGVAVVKSVYSLQGSMIGRQQKNGPQGDGVNENVSFTLNTVDKHGVVYSSSKSSFFTTVAEEKASTLCASDYKDPPIISDCHYTVRRITPVECARLQGFPDWWCLGLASENPSDEEIERWIKIFEEFRMTTKPETKPKSRNQVIKWLKEPYTDSAEYRIWGNGIALPCVYFVLAGIAYYSQN